MTEVIAGLVSGAFVALAAYLGTRNNPSRRVNDTASIVDSSGKVITTLRQEIDRLDAELEEARTEAKAFRAEAQSLRMELLKRPTRDELLDENGRLRRQLIELGETPANGGKK